MKRSLSADQTREEIPYSYCIRQNRQKILRPTYPKSFAKLDVAPICHRLLPLERHFVTNNYHSPKKLQPKKFFVSKFGFESVRLSGHLSVASSQRHMITLLCNN
jgi:hypothetical protein